MTDMRNAPAANPELEAMDLKTRLAGIVGRMQAEVENRITKRKPLEDRWIEDLEQYHGRYDTKTDRALKDDDAKSKLFINLTRPKTDAMSARLMDLLFPTDDRNWGIGPTPVPMLNDDASAAVKALREIEDQLEAMQKQQEAAGQGEDPAAAPPATDPALEALEEKAEYSRKKAARLQAIIEEARHRADAMALEIEDQLSESSYHASMRDVIDDACKLGTGVAKGPITGDKVRKGWKKQKTVDPETGEAVSGAYELDAANADQTPAMRYTNIWDFFPDMDVRDIQTGEGTFERHLLNTRGLRKLGQLPGFDKDALRRLLAKKPNGVAPHYLTQLRDITKSIQNVGKDTYHVYEYSGPLSAEDIRDIALAKQDDAALGEVAELDPLTEVNVILWFCDGEVLKIAPYPFDSGETLYSVFNLIKDEASVFGYGIPHVMAHPQRALNAGWRIMLDNAGLASGPQIVIATDLIEPTDGDWTLKPRKTWQAKAGIPQDRRAFMTYDIPMHQEEMANIIAISKQFIDDMTGMPSITQGEDITGPQRTAQGTALLMNSANVTFRRIVKAFDDDMTVPNIRRLYDWNMQFNPKDEIKGDYSVDARGSSVLLVRELQAQNLMVIALQLGAHPIYGPMLKNKELLRKLFQAHMIPADEVLLSSDEIDAIMASAAKPEEDPEAMRVQMEAEARSQDQEIKRAEIEAKIQIANMENGTRQTVAELNHQTAMMSLAEKMNMQVDQLEAMLEKTRREIDHKERVFAAETAVTERVGPTGGGYF